MDRTGDALTPARRLTDFLRTDIAVGMFRTPWSDQPAISFVGPRPLRYTVNRGENMELGSLPTEAERTLKQAFGPDLDRAAIEALAIEGYRTAKLTAGEVARVLGLDTSIEAQAWLAGHGVAHNYSLEDLESDRASLAGYFPEMAR